MSESQGFSIQEQAASNRPLQTAVLIVGAGPTGLSLAVQLMRYGVDFVICDKKEGVTDLSKALVVHARTLEIYDQVGLAHKAVEGGEIGRAVTLLHEGKDRARVNLEGFGQGLSPFPFALIFEQSKNERLLFDYLQQNGHNVIWKSELQSLTQDADGVRSVVRSVDGNLQTIEARYLVGCDGASSATRHQLGLGFEGSTYPRLFYVADVDVDTDLDKSSLYLAPGDDSFAMLFPMQGHKHWRLLGNLPEYEHEGQIDQQVPYSVIEDKVKSLVKRPLDILHVRWFSTYKVHTRYAERFSQGRCFLAGDAAHVHTPAGGQGMNTGIQDVYNLAWKLAFVLKGKGQAHEALLETYNEERLANAKRLLRTTDEVFDVMAGDHWYQNIFRNTLLPNLMPFVSRSRAAKEFLFPTLSQIGITYRDNALSQHGGDRHFKIKAGDRMPYFEVEETGIYNKLRAPCFHCLVFSSASASSGESESYAALKSELASRYGDTIDFVTIVLSPHIGEIFGASQPFLILLRPDNYIAFLSSNISIDEVESFFARPVIDQTAPSQFGHNGV